VIKETQLFTDLFTTNCDFSIILILL